MKASLVILGVLAAALATLAVAAWLRDVPGVRSERPSEAAQARGPDVAGNEPDAGTGVLAADGPKVSPDAVRNAATAERNDPIPRRRLLGRVVDERRFPVVAAAVSCASADQTLASASTDARGGFELAFDEPSSWIGVTVRVRAEDGRCALVRQGPPVSEDLGIVVLGPAAPLRVRVLRGSIPVAGAAVAVDVGATRVSLLDGASDAGGIAEFPAVPEGVCWVLARWGDEAGRARVFVPEDALADVRLAPTCGQELDVVAADDGEPVVGAEVTLREEIWMPSIADPNRRQGEGVLMRRTQDEPAFTDAKGRVAIGGLDRAARYEAWIRADGFEPVPGAPGRQGVRLSCTPGVVRVTLQRVNARTVRVPVVAGELPVPAPDAPLDVRFESRVRRPGDDRVPPGAIAMGRGEFQFAWRNGGDLLAVAPDGGLARIRVPETGTDAKETSFMRPRSVTVHLADIAGAPVPGARVEVRTLGNVPLALESEADEQGTCVVGGLHPQVVDVWIAGPRRSEAWTDPWTEAGKVDLKGGDGAMSATLPGDASVRLRLRVDGVPALPRDYRVWARGTPSSARVLEERADRGELLLALPVARSELGSTMEIGVVGTDELAGWAKFAPTLEAESVIAIDLVRAGRLEVRVERAEGTRVEIGIERQDATSGAFASTFSFNTGRTLSVPNGPGESFRFGGLPAGRYRAVEGLTGATSAAVDVVSGALVPVSLDVTSAREVTGRVVGPEGEDLGGARVILLNADLPSDASAFPFHVDWPRGAPVRADGTFRLLVPGDREVEVRAWHPWLQPAPEGGSLRTREGATNVVLTLVEGQEVRLGAPQLAPPYVPRPIARVGAWDGTFAGEPSRWIPGVLSAGQLRFGGLEPGRWTLLVDVADPAFAPLVLEDVQIERGTTVLPAASFSRGSSLHVRLLTGPGAGAPSVWMTATRLDAPAYQRSTSTYGTEEAVLQGLGPGRFRVRLSRSGRPWLLDREITFDGVTDQTLEVDVQ